jgi:hypothetical protein
MRSSTVLSPALKPLQARTSKHAAKDSSSTAPFMLPCRLPACAGWKEFLRECLYISEKSVDWISFKGKHPASIRKGSGSRETRSPMFCRFALTGQFFADHTHRRRHCEKSPRSSPRIPLVVQAAPHQKTARFTQQTRSSCPLIPGRTDPLACWKAMKRCDEVRDKIRDPV